MALGLRYLSALGALQAAALLCNSEEPNRFLQTSDRCEGNLGAYSVFLSDVDFKENST